jgi:hypothetical protein
MMLVGHRWCFCLARFGDVLYRRAGGGAGRHPLVSWCGETNGIGWGFVGVAEEYVFVSIDCSMQHDLSSFFI